MQPASLHPVLYKCNFLSNPIGNFVLSTQHFLQIFLGFLFAVFCLSFVSSFIFIMFALFFFCQQVTSGVGRCETIDVIYTITIGFNFLPKKLIFSDGQFDEKVTKGRKVNRRKILFCLRLNSVIF